MTLIRRRLWKLDAISEPSGTAAETCSVAAGLRSALIAGRRHHRPCGSRLIDAASAPAKVILFGSRALGFHVQQAVEKRLKAMLALNEYEHTHSVSYLQALIEQQGIDLPLMR